MQSQPRLISVIPECQGDGLEGEVALQLRRLALEVLNWLVEGVGTVCSADR